MTDAKFCKNRLMHVTDVYFHESCPDGTAAALICAAAFQSIGMRPRFYPLQYNTDLMRKLEPRTGQLFVDITPPKERWEEWKQVQPIVLDHHETVEVVTKGLDGVYETNDAHSGAKIAYEQVFQVLVPEGDDPILRDWRGLSELAMIRDTWKKTHSAWRDACALAMALLFEGSRGLVDKAQEKGIQALDLTHLLTLGTKLVESNDRRVKKLAESAYRETYNFDREYKAAYFNCTEKIVSDVANFMIDNGCNIAVGYFYLFEDGATRCQVSLRTDGTLSARKIAERFPGGGGHERAAGFRLPEGDQTSPYKLYSVVSETIVEMLTSQA